MEERKTIAIVLGILVLIAVFLSAIWPKVSQDTPHELSYKNGAVKVYYIKGMEEDCIRAAQNKLALCLCDIYKNKPDTTVGKKIVKIYKVYGSSIGADSLYHHKQASFNEIVKYKKMAFDTLVAAD